MSQLQFLLCLFSGFLLLSCNKGEFNPTQCDDCPELMSCYDGVCDCDRDSSFKIWNHCYWKYPTRNFCFDPDTNFGMHLMFLDSVSFDHQRNQYVFNMYSGERVWLGPILESDGITRPFQFYEVRIIPQIGFDSIYFDWDWFTTFQVDGENYRRSMFGARYGRDSMDLRIVHRNDKTGDWDTSRNMQFYYYD